MGVVMIGAIITIYLSWITRSVKLHSEFSALLQHRNQLTALRLSAQEYLTINWQKLPSNEWEFGGKTIKDLQPISEINENCNARIEYSIYSDGIWLRLKLEEKTHNFRLNYTIESDSMRTTNIQFLED
jgi:hypothetical protein